MTFNSSLIENAPIAQETKGTTFYCAGTLRYTKVGLVILFIWLLWGDFCFTLMEQVVPQLLPLKLKEIGASNFAIGLMVGSIPGIMNMVITPIVSFKSDRYRSRWGRRIPFLFWPTPFITLFLILIGYSDKVGTSVQSALTFFHFKPMNVLLVTVGVMVVCFQFFNMFVASVYYYLFNDVVPERFIGRFMAMFRIIGTAAGVFFNMFIFGKVGTHFREIFIGAALLYLLGFLLMCWRVKEGEYPPPHEKIGGTGAIASLKTFFTECFTHQYYIFFFIGTTLWTISCCSGIFMIFFAHSIGLSNDQFGKIAGWMGIPAMILLYPMGSLVDRFHPLRVTLLATFLLILANICSFFFIHDRWSYIVLAIILLPATVMFAAAKLPIYMSLLPKESYGQFCSAQALVNAIGLIAGNLMAGKFIDLVGNYRYIYIWSAFFQVLSLFFMILVWKKWKTIHVLHYNRIDGKRKAG